MCGSRHYEGESVDVSDVIFCRCLWINILEISQTNHFIYIIQCFFHVHGIHNRWLFTFFPLGQKGDVSVHVSRQFHHKTNFTAIAGGHCFFVFVGQPHHMPEILGLVTQFDEFIAHGHHNIQKI